jgi:hypothetical protein
MSTKSLEERIAEALLYRGSPRHAVRAGAMLTLLSELAREGDLEGFSRACLTYAGLVPSDRQQLVAAVPAKVLNQYLYLHCGRAASSLEKWCERNADWAERITSALEDPVRFRAEVLRMSAEAGNEAD